MALTSLMKEVRACRLCAAHLPLGPNPIIRLSPQSRLLLIGQAPGTKVHETGIPWNDPSGERLRAWMGIDRAQFYETPAIGIMPMGFCYPGKTGSGDAPPRPECAPAWHEKLRDHLPNIELTVLIGSYAQAYYLGEHNGPTLTDTVRDWKAHLSRGFLPLVHPSPRNQIWLRRNPWFEAELVPVLQSRVRRILKSGGT